MSQFLPCQDLTPAAFGLQKACYSVNETLHLTSISRTTLYALIKDRRLRPIKVGRKTLIGADDLVSLLSTLRGEAA